ncbi:MAG: hypothetical protein V1770_02230 [bacterium]
MKKKEKANASCIKVQLAKTMYMLYWSRISGQTVEFELGGKTFQITGREGMTGYWEKIFHENSNPTRREVGVKEMNNLVEKAESFRVYALHEDEGEDLSPEELDNRIKETFSGSKKEI